MWVPLVLRGQKGQIQPMKRESQPTCAWLSVSTRFARKFDLGVVDDGRALDAVVLVDDRWGGRTPEDAEVVLLRGDEHHAVTLDDEEVARWGSTSPGDGRHDGGQLVGSTRRAVALEKLCESAAVSLASSRLGWTLPGAW